MSVELMDLATHSAPRGSLASISVALDAAPRQVRQSRGLVATLVLSNQGDAPITLLTPLEMLQFQLFDEKGYPLKLPTAPPSILVHTAGEPSPVAAPPISIVAAMKDGRPIDVRLVAVRTLTVGPGETYKVTFSIESVADRPLTDGEYTIRCIATLINAKNPAESRILESPKLQVRFMPLP